jgi:diguanylate cyclase (GGDEF)-like protein
VTGVGRGTATGAARERYRIEAAVLAIGSQGAATGRRMLLTGCLTLRQLYPANRLGPSAEFTRAHAHLAGVTNLAGLHRLSHRMFDRVTRIAAELGDPRLVANAAWVDAIIRSTARNTKVDVSKLMRELLTEHGRWLHAQEYLSAATVLCNQLTNFGYADQARTWNHRTRAQLVHVEQSLDHYGALVGAAIDAILGRGEEANRQLAASAQILDQQPDNREQGVQYVMTALYSAVEQEQFGGPLEAAAAEFTRWGITPRRTWPLQHYIWASLAYGRLALCLRTTDDERPARLAAAKEAIREFRRASTTPLLKVHLLIVRAHYAQLTGKNRAALRLLQRAERRAERLDAPVVGYEVARVRARALKALGNDAEARRQARTAFHLALELGWEYRARAVRNEFAVGESSTVMRTTAGLASTASGELHRRRLNALQQVSLAAATVLDPRELARVALDKTLSIFGADRAFLFLVDKDTGQLVPHLGRDAAGADLDVLTGYGASLVTRVLDTVEPLVVTSAEDGMALGSQSALIHGLRSIMVAPLALKGRVQGVVYLDSRVAKGIFTADDVDILVAITNHVAVALETARAAQLEVAVRAAREQRDLAESMRSAMAEVSTTLDPNEVLQRLLTVVARDLPVDAGCLFRRKGDMLVAVGGYGAVPTGLVGADVDPARDPALAGLAAIAAPVLGGVALGQAAPAAELLPGAVSWIAVPLAGRGESVGLLLIASHTADAYTEAHVQIAAALAGQGMTAYENARLFDQLHELATVDALSGVANRRHFFELAEGAFAARQPEALTLAAIMLDIDNFKHINDGYGHMVGDEVIREVARRLGHTMRDGDLLGRYGGEEFALIVTSELRDAEQLAERLRAAVGEAPVRTAAGPLTVTVSVGLAVAQAGDRDLGIVLGRADVALYNAKAQGRDRVVAA